MPGRKLSELTRSKRRNAWLTHLYNDSPVMMHSIDTKGRFCDVNREWLSQTGYERSEVIGKPASFLMTEASASYFKESVLPRFWQDGFVRNIAYDYIRKDGSLMQVLLDCVATTDERGRRISLSVVRDMTEINRLHQQSLEYTRLQSTLEIAGTICHELNQPLQVLVGRLDLIRLQGDYSDKMRAHLDSITQSVKKISDITLKLKQITNYRTKPYLDSIRIIDLGETADSGSQPDTHKPQS